jgi:flavin-dependent dehydrogenase
VRITVRSGGRTLGVRSRRIRRDGREQVIVKFRRRAGHDARVTIVVRATGPNGSARGRFRYRL